MMLLMDCDIGGEYIYVNDCDVVVTTYILIDCDMVGEYIYVDCLRCCW